MTELYDPTIDVETAPEAPAIVMVDVYYSALSDGQFITGHLKIPEGEVVNASDRIGETIVDVTDISIYDAPEGIVYPAAIVEAQFEVEKTAAIKAVVDRANGFTAPILNKYPEAERAGWFKREEEARSIIAAADKAAAIAATAIIKSLVEAAGETTDQAVTRAQNIVDKADSFAAISAQVEIMRDQSITALNAVTNGAELEATIVSLKAQATALAAQYGLL